MIRGTTYGTITAVLALLSAAPASAQGCGDNDISFSITSTYPQIRTEVLAWTWTAFQHASDHPSCSGMLAATAQLWVQSTPTFCNVDESGSTPMATYGNEGHEVTAERVCTVYQCSTEYHTRGRHFFNGQNFRTTLANKAKLGECPPEDPCHPCERPGYIPGNCERRRRDACNCCPAPTSPIVIDRSRDGMRFSSAEDGALFNINGWDTLWLGWPTTPDDAWLALDRNDSGCIENGTELFGNTRRLRNGKNAEHGYEVLAELDENKDGVIDSADPLFAKLLLWGDANRDGVCEPRELVKLRDTNIRSLGLAYAESDARDEHRNWFKLMATDKSSVDVFVVSRYPDSVLEMLAEEEPDPPNQ